MRIPTWFAFAESMLARLTRPVDDVTASDSYVEHILTRSSLFRFGGGVAAAIGRAWKYSSLRATIATIALDVPEGGGERGRLIAIVLAVAVLTVVMSRLLAFAIARA